MCAVVCDVDFDVSQVVLVHPTRPFRYDTIRMLSQLSAAEIIEPVDAPEDTSARLRPQQRYRFASTLVQEVVYKMLPQTQVGAPARAKHAPPRGVVVGSPPLSSALL